MSCCGVFLELLSQWSFLRELIKCLGLADRHAHAPSVVLGVLLCSGGKILFGSDVVSFVSPFAF